MICLIFKKQSGKTSDVALCKCDGGLALGYGYGAVLVGAESANDRLSAILGCEKLCLNALTDRCYDMLVGAELTLKSGRGHVKVIKSLDRVDLVKYGIDRSVNLFTVLNVNTCLAVDGDLEMVIRSYLGLGNVPDLVAKLGYRRLNSLAYGFLNTFLHTSS